MSQEAIELLEKAEKHLSEFVPTSGHNPLNWAYNCVHDALDLLRKTPKASEFTKEGQGFHLSPRYKPVKQWIDKACTRLDQLEAANKAQADALKILGDGVERYNSLTVVISRGSYELARQKTELQALKQKP